MADRKDDRQERVHESGGVATQLSLSARPRTLDGLFGQARIVKAIRGHFSSGRYPKAWLFSGPRGTGKTTTARILSISYQCTHQEPGRFGRPCKACRRLKSSFPIFEINAADVTGIDKLREMLYGADFGVMGVGSYRIYILDECHQLSTSAQNLLLKYLEDTSDTTVFILCSTMPQKILETVRSRCQCYEFRELDNQDVEAMVNWLLRRIQSTLPADRLIDALIDNQVHSPRLIAMAVDKYAAGLDPDEAVQVNGAVTIDTRALTRAVVRGDWPGVARFMQNAQNSDVRGVRLSLIAYLKTVLLETPEISTRADAVAKSLTSLSSIGNAEDMVIAGALSAELYRLCAIFERYKIG